MGRCWKRVRMTWTPQISRVNRKISVRATIVKFSCSTEGDTVRSMSNIPLPPAPGSDTHVSLALADSVVSLPGGQSVDELADPAAATSWLVDHDLVPAETVLLEYCQ